MTWPDYTTAIAFLQAWHPGGPWSVGAIDPDDPRGLAWLTTSEASEVTASSGACRTGAVPRP